MAARTAQRRSTGQNRSGPANPERANSERVNPERAERGGPTIVPCHRVIGANGSLTGYGGGLDAKRWLLDHEARHAGLTLV